MALVCPCLGGWGQVVSRGTLYSGLQEVKFTHLIMATGTDGCFPGKFITTSSLQTAVQAYSDLVEEVTGGNHGHGHMQGCHLAYSGAILQVQKADSILVVGGGTTGVEMAAELKTAHPHKKVTFGLGICINLHPQCPRHSGFGSVCQMKINQSKVTMKSVCFEATQDLVLY